MSLKRNILANYIGQFYVTLIGILLVPMYVKYMGVEAYGLVGFFAMLQAWFMLLDMGLTPTMARETARFQGGAIDALSLRRLLRALEGIFIGIAILGGLTMMAASGYIASRWLKVQHLPLEEVQNAIMLIAVIVALRWACGLYRGAINGFERLVWLNGFNIIVATVRFVLVIPFFIYVGTTLSLFFTYQLVIAVVEMMVLVSQTYRLLPKVASGQRIPWQWEPLRGVLNFSLSIALLSLVGVLVSQIDKLLLSKLLSLSDYAYFTMSVLMASGVMVVSVPIGSALLPRLVKLAAEGDEAELIRLYRNATQMVAVIAIPAALMLALFAEQVLWAWTGNAEIARKAAPVLTLYALGNSVFALAALPYYLQFAKGDLKMHLIGNALLLVLLVPTLAWATWRYGAIGAGYAWLGANLTYFLLWLPRVHARFKVNLHKAWLLADICAIVLPTAVIATIMFSTLKWPDQRIFVAILIALSMLVLLITAASSSTWARGAIKHFRQAWV